MKKRFIEEIKEILGKRKKEIKSQLLEIGKKSSREKNSYDIAFPDYGRADDENADEVSTYVDRLSLKENLEKELSDIDIALRKIRKGTYGICESCGKKISEKRLRVLPTARFCLKCKNKGL